MNAKDKEKTEVLSDFFTSVFKTQASYSQGYFSPWPGSPGWETEQTFHDLGGDS